MSDDSLSQLAQDVLNPRAARRAGLLADDLPPPTELPDTRKSQRDRVAAERQEELNLARGKADVAKARLSNPEALRVIIDHLVLILEEGKKEIDPIRAAFSLGAAREALRSYREDRIVAEAFDQMARSVERLRQ